MRDLQPTVCRSSCKRQRVRLLAAMSWFISLLIAPLLLLSGLSFTGLAELSQDGGLAASWRNSTEDCCSWEGITCNANMEVTGVSLASRGLEGHVSPSLGNLRGMSRLNLSCNSLSGSLPPELMSSSSMVSLDVSFNLLSGALQDGPIIIPGRRRPLPLQVLNISSNFFTGVFPSTTWGKTGHLVALNASNNSFTGQIPSSFCVASSSFAVLDLSYNQFSGNIPPGLGKCSGLRVLKAAHNSITGTLPDELFGAAAPSLVSNNMLEGALDAASISRLTNLISLDLSANGFSGKIPDSIGQLKRLEELHLDHNNMSGELPASLSKCTNLTTIDLKINNFQGELGNVNFSALINLKSLDLALNNFTGTVPESIYSCINMTSLRLARNKLHGQLSNRVGNLKSLSFLSLTENNFTNITNQNS